MKTFVLNNRQRLPEIGPFILKNENFKELQPWHNIQTGGRGKINSFIKI